jgi:hypothetical protein
VKVRLQKVILLTRMLRAGRVMREYNKQLSFKLVALNVTCLTNCLD